MVPVTVNCLVLGGKRETVIAFSSVGCMSCSALTADCVPLQCEHGP